MGLLLAVFWGASWAARAYPRSRRGLALFVIDHTWSLPNTVAGSLYLLLHLAMRHSIDRDSTFHSGQIHIVERLNRHYAMTIGPVVAGATPALRRHEDVHVFQARVLGPLYLPLVGLNYVLFTIAPVWLLYHDYERWPIKGPITYFTCGVYPHVWHEAWAFRRDGGRDERHDVERDQKDQ
ncbi:MAG TPA: glycine zipper family protein [Micromonosporaceae bacterium]|nr:glycine zipper family protein [Micromonosporaceae bacterium]